MEMSQCIMTSMNDATGDTCCSTEYLLPTRIALQLSLTAPAKISLALADC